MAFTLTGPGIGVIGIKLNRDSTIPPRIYMSTPLGHMDSGFANQTLDNYKTGHGQLHPIGRR